MNVDIADDNNTIVQRLKVAFGISIEMLIAYQWITANWLLDSAAIYRVDINVH